MNKKNTLLSILFILLYTLLTGCMANKSSSTFKEERLSENKMEDSLIKEEEMIQEKDLIQEELEDMTIDEKIGQMLLVGIDGYEVNDQGENLIKDYHVGGIILYGKNVKSKEQLKDLLDSLKYSNRSNKVPLFLSVDEEGGTVTRIPKGVKKFPSARKIGQSKDSSIAFENGKSIGQVLRSFGFNMNFAPVLDIDNNPQNPVIGSRAFGPTPEVVSEMGLATMEGLQDQGIIPVIKHFPGHGDTNVDSHKDLPIIFKDWKALKEFEILPFQKSIDEGVDVIMVAHLLLPEIDDQYPASMSKIVMTDLLRKELGFEGVIITDDLTMGAVTKNYGIGEAAIQSLEAGADILLIGHEYDKEIAVINALKNAVESGNVSMERIDESVYRILQLKEKYELAEDIK